MWPPPNIQYFPSKEEIQWVKEETSTIELKIIEAELRLDVLRKSLFERKAWITSIRKMPHEILSLIFVEASRVDWKAPLVLQSVCRRWRDVVMDSPEAWTFIPLSEYSSELESDLISLFLERGRNTPLHISIDRFNADSLLEYMEPLAYRIECIHITATWFLRNRYLQRGHAFHRLERLKIDDSNVYSTNDVPSPEVLAAWDMLLFPNLKVLNIRSSSVSPLRAISAAPEFPAIRHLTVRCEDPRPLPDILIKCATSLESADLTYENWDPEGLDTEHKINFPRLRCLRLSDWSDEARPRFRFKAATPNLHAYIDEGNISTLNTVKVDTGGISLLNVLRTPDFSLYPRLVTLCFSGGGGKGKMVIKATKCLRDNPALCPDLALIEYTTQLTEDQTAKATAALMARGDVTRHTIQLKRGTPKVREERIQASRGVETCGDNMPCNSSF